MGFKVSVAVVDRAGLAIVMLRGGLDRQSAGEREHAVIVHRARRVRSIRHSFDEIGRRLAEGAGGISFAFGTLGGSAVGVSGSPGKDDVCSQAGTDKVADQLK